MTLDDIPTIDPAQEPEYVGAHGAVHRDTCQNWRGSPDERPERCDAEATHTVVLFSDRYHILAMCDDCGEPEDAADDREWSGEHRPVDVAGGETDG